MGGVRLCRLLRMGCQGPEAGFVSSKPEELALNRLPRLVLSDEAEFAIVGDQHEAIMIEVFRCLLALRRLPTVVAERLNFDDPTFGNLTLPGFRCTVATLLPAVKPEIGMPCTRVAQLAIADNGRVQQLAEVVQQVFECRVIRGFAGRAARAPDFGHALQVCTDRGFNGCHYFFLQTRASQTTQPGFV